MDKDSLIQARDAVVQRFNELQRLHNENAQELNRLQGEYRTYETLISQLLPETPEAEVVKKAIEVTDAQDTTKQ